MDNPFSALMVLAEAAPERLADIIAREAAATEADPALNNNCLLYTSDAADEL